MPRPVTWFQCEICDEYYQDQDAAANCERKGIPPSHYGTLETVTVFLDNRVHKQGVVSGITLEKGTHKPLYVVAISPSEKIEGVEEHRLRLVPELSLARK